MLVVVMVSCRSWSGRLAGRRRLDVGSRGRTSGAGVSVKVGAVALGGLDVDVPPWLLATWRTMARPRPVPPCHAERARSTR